MKQKDHNQIWKIYKKKTKKLKLQIQNNIPTVLNSKATINTFFMKITDLYQMDSKQDPKVPRK